MTTKTQMTPAQLKDAMEAAKIGFALIKVQEQLSRSQGVSEEDRLLIWFNSFKNALVSSGAPVDLPMFLNAWLIVNWPFEKAATDEKTVTE